MSQLVSRAFDSGPIIASKYNFKKISALEVENEMELGLCLLCDEPLTLDHEKKYKGLGFLVIEMMMMMMMIEIFFRNHQP